jgi:hypothetical protein
MQNGAYEAMLRLLRDAYERFVDEAMVTDAVASRRIASRRIAEYNGTSTI